LKKINKSRPVLPKAPKYKVSKVEIVQGTQVRNMQTLNSFAFAHSLNNEEGQRYKLDNATGPK